MLDEAAKRVYPRPAALAARRYVFATLSIAGVVPLLLALPSHLNLTTVALVFVLAVMLVAMRWSSGPALWGAILAMLLFNFFFIPPIHTLAIAGSENWVALVAFVITALVVGQLSSRARRRARQAEEQKIEIEKLYRELERTYREANEAELLRRSEKLKTALLDAVTHDLRTPLTSIKSSATTLLGELAQSNPGSSLDREAQQELLEVIDEEADRLNRFVEEMMELAQIEAGHLSLHRRTASAHDIVEAALNRAAGILKRHRIEVTIEDQIPTLQVDAASISEVVFSLLDNAAKFSPANTLIHLSAGKESASRVRFMVEDEGPGVSPDSRERIFEKFFREQPVKAQRPGFGMGLAIAKGIVEAHGGRIWVESSRNGHGSCFTFTAPISEVAQA